MILPTDFKQLLKTFNGEKSWLAVLGNGNAILSCENIIQYYQEDAEHSDYADDEMNTLEFWQDRVANGIIRIKGSVKPLITYHTKWIPFTCCNGDVFRYFDFDPAEGGIMGQIIEVDPENCSYKVIATNLTELLTIYLDELNQNLFEAEDGLSIQAIPTGTELWPIPEWLGIDETMIDPSVLNQSLDEEYVLSQGTEYDKIDYLDSLCDRRKPENIEKIIPLLDDKNNRVVLHAISTLGNFKHHAGLPKLLEMLSSTDETIIIISLVALYNVVKVTDDHILAKLYTFLDHTNKRIVKYAINAIANIHHQDSAIILMNIFWAAKSEVKLDIVIALGKIGNPASLPLLEEYIVTMIRINDSMRAEVIEKAIARIKTIR
jgi:cell wall assembly regulator SMI1